MLTAAAAAASAPSFCGYLEQFEDDVYDAL